MFKSLIISAVAIASFSTVFSGLQLTSSGDIFGPFCTAHPNTTVCQDAESANKNNNPVITLITAIIEIVSYLTGAAGVILIVISGIKFATSGGDSNAVASARGTLIYALVGIIITVIAQLIVAFVLNNINISQ